MTVEEIFGVAVEKPPGERAAYLHAACAGDPELRAQVEALIRSHEGAGSLLEKPLFRTAPTVDHVPPAEEPGAVIGPYKLVEPIGEGGMGAVWMAQQTEPVRRLVAVKLIKAGMDSKQVIARFEAERQALALMDHPNIARVLDAGTTDAGRPYFVMDLVKGMPITRYCDEHRLTPRQRLELFLPVCRAVQHAHQKGVIHRDLKPSNVLVALYDGRPVPKVIDFGIAKAAGQPLTDKTLVTGFGAIVGTLEYMSPEQAEVNQLDVDTRSDIYSLGVLLYELLTGSPPFSRKELEKAGMLEVLRVIREQEPSKPSTKLSTTEGLPTLAANRGTEPAKLTKLVRGELDWIVMKALEKDRTRRYETANGFAIDVQRYLAGEAVQAVPPSAGYRVRKFLKRNKGPVLAALVVLVALVAGIIGTTWQALRARQAEAAALADRDAKGAALEAERQARQEAVRAGERTLEALRAMTEVTVSRLIAGQEQLTARDRAFFTRVIAQFERLAAVKGDGPESRALRAEGHYRVGFMRYRLQEWPDALPAFERARDLYRDLAADFPAVPAYRHQLAQSHKAVGEVLTELGRRPAAEAEYRQAIAQFERLGAAFPGSPEYRLGASSTRCTLASLLGDHGGPAEAEAEYRRAVTDTEQLVRDFPEMPAYRHQLGRVHVMLGGLLQERLKRPADAEAQFRRALALHTKLAADSPDTPEYRVGAGACHESLGRALAGQGQPADAAAEYRAGLAIVNRLVAQFPAVPKYRQSLARLRWTLGSALVDQGKPVDAEQEYRLALALQERLVSDFPDVPAYRDQLAQTCKYLGIALEKQGLLDQAVTAHRQAVEQRPNWPSAYFCLIDVLLRTGRLDEAVAACREAIQAPIKGADRRGWLLNKIAWILATYPDPKVRNPIRAMEIGKEAVGLNPSGAHWTTLGVAHYRAGDYKAAAAALERSMAVRKGGDGIDWFFLAMAHWQLGARGEARTWYDKAVAWMDKNKPKDEDLRRFRAEAAALLGVAGGRVEIAPPPRMRK